MMDDETKKLLEEYRKRDEGEERLEDLCLGLNRKHENEPEAAGYFISSIDDAIEQLYWKSGAEEAQNRKTIIDYITNPEKRLYGSDESYHRLIMELSAAGEYGLGIRICDHLLEQLPYNPSYLGDAINLLGECRQFAKGDELIQRAERIPYERWMPELFCACGTYLRSKLTANPQDSGIYGQALSLAEEYIKRYPFDERGYHQEAELLILMNKRDEAISELRRIIFEVQPDKDDSRSELICPRCCAALVRLLSDTNNYDYILQICERGLRFTAGAESGEEFRFFVLHKAMAYEAKAHAEGFKVPDTIRAAMKCYQIVKDLHKGYERTQAQDDWNMADDRLTFLRPYADRYGIAAPGGYIPDIPGIFDTSDADGEDEDPCMTAEAAETCLLPDGPGEPENQGA